MKILSIDVGIKNLAFCLLDGDYKITKWNIINLSQQSEKKCCEETKNIICNKPAKFMKDNKCYCLKHSKKKEYQIPSSNLKPSFINKQNIQSLIELADSYKLNYTKPIKKKDLILIINEYISNNCFEPVETQNASKLDLVNIGRNIQYNFDNVFSDEIMSIDKVIIENQISPIANRMKTIQGMIAQYFIMKNNNIQIEFVNASNKLKIGKVEKKEKTNYSDRKKIGIQKCSEIINTYNYKEWELFFKTHSKKDDLADCFLQGLWYISK